MKSWPLALQKSAEADADDACQGPGQHGISDAAYAADGYCCCQLEQPNQLMLMMRRYQPEKIAAADDDDDACRGPLHSGKSGQLMLMTCAMLPTDADDAPWRPVKKSEDADADDARRDPLPLWKVTGSLGCHPNNWKQLTLMMRAVTPGTNHGKSEAADAGDVRLAISLAAGADETC